MKKRTEGVCWIFSFGAYVLKRILNIGGHFVEYSAEGWMAERTQSQTFAQYIRTRSKVRLQLRDDIRPCVYKSGIFQERFILCFARAKSLFSEAWSTSYLHKEIFEYLAFHSIQFSSVAQLCLTLCDPVDSSLPGSPVRGILQARILEWVAILFSSILAWRIPGTGEPGGLLSMGSRRVGHD